MIHLSDSPVLGELCPPTVLRTRVPLNVALFENWIFTEAIESMATIEMGTWTQDRQTEPGKEGNGPAGSWPAPEAISLANLPVYTHTEKPPVWGLSSGTLDPPQKGQN